LDEPRVRILGGAECLDVYVVFYSGNMPLVVPDGWPGEGGPPKLNFELDGAFLPMSIPHPKEASPILLGPHSIYGFPVAITPVKYIRGKHALRLVYRGTGLSVKSPAELDSDSITIDCD